MEKEKLGFDVPLEEAARRAREFYRQHGAWPAAEVHRILGHPSESVRGGPGAPAEQEPKK